MYDDERAPRRVVITGLGTVTSIGLGVTAFLDGLKSGRSGVKPITAFDTTGFAHANGCEVDDFEPADWIQRADPAELGRATQFSIAAAKMAVEDAGLSPEELRERKVLVSVGTTDAESRDLDLLVGQQLENGPEHLDHGVVRRAQAGRLSSGIVRELGLVDVEALTIPTACAAGNYAIGSGFDAIRDGDVEAALCGGADAVCRKTFTGFYRLGTIAPEVCQPFDKDRKGILTGEGAGILLMESLESATARGARIYAEVLGYGLNCDAHHPVAPDADSLARCMEVAHRNAGVKAEDIDFISAHGTGTHANDVTEAGAIRQVFDSPPPTISIKSMIGHSMGAASALGSAACALALTEGFIPPTINHRETDPEVGLDCVPNEARPARLNVVQNNALAFAGNNAVLILGRYEEAV
ncbi:MULTISPECIES: beta-ketoacyl synthase [unclassified Streptomyces]|uniref:beta-ketoacyl-[acyl-carrier-protein] synthase family protein n=1 Tax=unclassified Streptomyces TaxID=2593676 RepID=UPI001BE7A1C9|nr:MULTISPECIES: beta-ketoacyl-[acyl-carrier-protein] synthase family protein [unclassified Streptomyces]MBT2405492.1 beta-ketoacyl-[acyl-carrier-protein] synthase family protein [Streptomyces sp. ISL-21]MBT2454410.1 beta-ketoacyl-[acyl-carrier-protein] synthase family protein [Streptomyces sp. ISL-86]MBT2607829.1 beta-ketoacyl-[acyl-carrier-protein] synthase family protein [Streptomyces sp. ISL-87]